jgi:thiol-disulfide isomerase/thioredoxin
MQKFILSRFGRLALISTLVVVGLALAYFAYRGLRPQSRTKILNVPSPRFTMKDFDGNTVSSADLKGKIVILEFWDTRCGPCRYLMPGFEKLSEKYRGRQDVMIICVNAGWESLQSAKIFVDEEPFKLFFTYMEKRESKKLIPDELPCTILIDKNFKLRYKHIGFNEKTEQTFISDLEERIEKAGDQKE